MNSCEIVHRLLFQALLELRAEGHESGNKTVFHLADLFHNAVLRMKSAAQGDADCTFDDVLNHLKQRADEKDCREWLEQRLDELSARAQRSNLASSPASK